MLLNVLENLGDGDVSKSILPGLVVDNNDPTGAQKIKCRISVLHQGVDDAHLPWCRPIKSNIYGIQEVSVPPIGAIAAIQMNSEDDNTNLNYMGTYVLDGSLPAIFKSVFPNCYGFIDANGSVFFVDTLNKTTLFNHCGGSMFAITMTTVNIISSGDANIKAMGNANIAATGAVNLDGASINLNGGSNPALSLAPQPQLAPAIVSNTANKTEY